MSKKIGVGIIFLFVIILLILFATPARSEPELRVEAGSTVLKGETAAVGMTVRWRESGPVGTDWEGGFRLIHSSDEPGRMNSPRSFTLHGQIVDGYKGFEAGFGFAFTNVDNLYHCRFTANLTAGLDGHYLPGKWNDRMTLRWYHNSSAGSCTPNTGRDVIMLGWKF